MEAEPRGFPTARAAPMASVMSATKNFHKERKKKAVSASAEKRSRAERDLVGESSQLAAWQKSSFKPRKQGIWCSQHFIREASTMSPIGYTSWVYLPISSMTACS